MILFFLVSCGYNNSEIAQPNQGVPTGSNGSAPTATDFTLIKAQVFQPYCLRCHSAAGGNRGGINLETYASVKPLLTRIKSAVNSGFMPPSGPLPDATKKLLIDWIDAGGVEKVSTSDTPPTDPSLPPGGPQISPPEDCEDHHHLVNEEYIVEVDQNYYYDVLSETFKKRHDDCDDDDHH